jgi:hypothetical protein
LILVFFRFFIWQVAANSARVRLEAIASPDNRSLSDNDDDDGEKATRSFARDQNSSSLSEEDPDVHCVVQYNMLKELHATTSPHDKYSVL